MPVFSTQNLTVNRMLVSLTKNHNVSRILVFSTEIAPLVIRLISSTENSIESHILQQFHNKMFRLLKLCYQNMYNWSRYNFELELHFAV